MKLKNISGTGTGKTGSLFTGNRKPVQIKTMNHHLPIPLKTLVRSWCDKNGVFMAEDGTHIIWNDNLNGKQQLIKLFLSYYKSVRTGSEYVFAKNSHFNRRVNVTGLMAVEHQLEKLNFDQSCMREFGGKMSQLKSGSI